MKHADIDALMEGIAPAIRAYMEKAMASITVRMDVLEKRFNALPAPRDGKDADLGEVRKIICEEISELKLAIEAIEPTSLPDIPAIVTEEVQKAVAAISAPKDGKSVTIEDVAPLITSEVEKRVSELPRPKDGEPGKDGESVDPAEVQRMVSEAVERVVSTIPVPKDGVDGKDGRDGKDGVGLAGTIIDRSGELVVTLTTGETKNLGPVVGRDGAPGEKGADGKDGRDGFGFEDLDLVETDGGLVLRFMRDGRVKDFRLPVVIDRGVYKEGQTYRPGDGVTWGGSFWICQQETSERPAAGKGFRLAVKKGRDGRDGVVKEAKPVEPVRVGIPVKAV
ncbi:hypothetical protein [Microvirga lenta]|uniref:hypothetical protein n=1 Tax=Microvirga lenta TaxID=2881337 RepID=UPI001CFD7FAA|nr:hypothetical protein [Microvirga lenta]MCB5173651.1 hypothetical protein [Microvirga lenta]